MANGLLRMQEEEFETLSNGLQGNSDKFVNTGDNYKTTFQGLVNTGLTGNSVGKIGNQMSAITNSINNVNNIIKKHSNQMFNFDRAVAKKADDIDIPNDFVSNDSASVNYYTQTLVGKIDGKSVNEGHETKKTKEIDDSVIDAEMLTDIRGATAKVEKYDGNSSINGKSVLGNISGNVTQEQAYDANLSVENASLKNISGNETQGQEYDSSSTVGKTVLTNISGNSTQQRSYDSSSTIGKTSLGSINGNATELKEYDDNTGMITKTPLKDVNNNEDTEQVSFDNFSGWFAADVAKEMAEAEKEKSTSNNG